MSGDREKTSFSERDRLRRERGQGHERPRGGGPAEAEKRRATAEALKEADTLFSQGLGGSAGRVLAQVIRDAQGSDGFADACRSYRTEVGLPDDPSLLALFLDTGDRQLVVAALEALLAKKQAGTLTIGPGLRGQLRVLAQDRDDSVAGISEDLLAG